MKTPLRLTALVLALAFPFAAFAAKANKKRPDAKDPAAAFAELDKNGDGSISQQEYVDGMKDKLGEDGAKKHFAELDKNKDGQLSKEELNAAPAEKGKPGKTKRKAKNSV
ncbi:MAG TPA: EF-hand domain-containing protein [Opitutaceae bacterium]|nr:EF-hand domain-containing protein [Opitutaceae bacterium]